MFQSRKTIRKTSRRFLPCIERLEDRIAPANNVLTSFAGGTLTITTVDQLGEAEILTGDNNQNFQIIGTGPGNVTVHKSGATTIDGGAADVLFSGVTNIVLDLKEGDDFVTAKLLNIAGDLTYKGGDGGNSLNLDSDTGTTKVRNVTFINGDGVDNFAFLDGTHEISGKVAINFGVGGSNSNIGFNAGDRVTLGGLSITGGAGADNINFFGTDFLANGPVTFLGGSGDNDVRMNLSNSLVFTQPLKIINGTGSAVFSVGNGTNKSSSFAGITITNGAGNNTVVFNSQTTDTINGNLIVTNGAGSNTVTVDPADFAVTGMIKIKNGPGNNATDITPTNTNTVGGAFSVTNGSGLTTTSIGGSIVDYQAVKLSNRNGGSTTTLNGGTFSFASIGSTNADGLDTFTVTATNRFEILTGGLTLKNGPGGSSTTIAATTSAAIAGLLSISNGEGQDTQVIGNGAGNFSGLHAVSISNGAGGSATSFNPAQLTITGSLSVTSGDGFNTFALGNGVLTSFNITGALKVSHGTGGSITNVAPATGGIVAGAFTVLTADGNDTVDLIRTTFSGATTITLGNGNDKFDIDNSTLAALKAILGAGGDQVRIEATTNDAIGTTILGTVTIDLGSGDDSVEWGLDANDIVTASQSVKILGGVGLDAFDQHAAVNSFIAGSPSLVGIEIQLP